MGKEQLPQIEAPVPVSGSEAILADKSRFPILTRSSSSIHSENIGEKKAREAELGSTEHLLRKVVLLYLSYLAARIGILEKVGEGKREKKT